MMNNTLFSDENNQEHTLFLIGLRVLSDLSLDTHHTEVAAQKRREFGVKEREEKKREKERERKKEREKKKKRGRAREVVRE